MPLTAIDPVIEFPPELLLAAQGLRVAIFDVDGVLTDGRIHIGEQGEAFKAFSTLDGHGLKLLVQGGIVSVVITGRDSPGRGRRLGADALRSLLQRQYAAGRGGGRAYCSAIRHGLNRSNPKYG